MGDKRDQVNSDWETELPAVFEGASVQSTMAPSGVEETEERERGTRSRRRGELPRLYPDPRTGKRKVRQGKARQDKPSFEMGVTTGRRGVWHAEPSLKISSKSDGKPGRYTPYARAQPRADSERSPPCPHWATPAWPPCHTHTPTRPHHHHRPGWAGWAGQAGCHFRRAVVVSVVCKLRGH